MHLRLPLWCYPAVLLFSVLMHGILVLFLMKGTEGNVTPKVIQWFDLTEQVPAALSTPSPLSGHKPSDQEMVRQSETVKSRPAGTDDFGNLTDISSTNDQEGPETLPTEAKEIQEPEGILPKGPVSFEEILKNTRQFSHQSMWSKLTQEKPVSSSLGSLLSGIHMIRITGNDTQNPANMKLDSRESEMFHGKLDHFFAQNWEVPLHLAESELTVVVRFRIDRQGKILASQIEKPSGKKELDRSVEDLLKNLKSLPSLPYSYPGLAYEFGIKFTPRDLQF